MNKKTNIGLLTLVFVLGVAVMTSLSIAGFKAGREISLSAVPQLTTAVQSGAVAGAAVEKATVIIDRGTGTTMSVEVSVADHGTALEALKAAASAYGLPLDVQSSSTMGAYVNAIGDMVGGQDNKYWIYYVNGQPATVAVDRQAVQPGDRIEFRFEKSSF